MLHGLRGSVVKKIFYGGHFRFFSIDKASAPGEKTQPWLLHRDYLNALRT